MKNSGSRRHSFRHDSVTLSRRVLVAALSLSICAPAALAAPRCIGYGGVAVPVSFDGLYINLVSGLQTPTSDGNPGWDFNPFYSGSPTSALSFAIQGPTAGLVASNGVVSPLVLGAHIGPSSTFVSGLQTSPAAMASYRAGVAGVQFLGIRFEDSGNIHYGSIQVETSGPSGNPARILQGCFEMLPNTMHPAGDGSYPVTLQHFSID